MISGVPVSVEWPASGVPSGWTSTTPDTIGAVVARGTALVFPFIRAARIPESVATQGRVIAWWSDGEAAAVEIATATACTRHVGVSVPPSSDVLHGQGARALLLALSAPCGGEIDMSSLAPTSVRDLQGTGNLAAATAFRGESTERTPWAALLLVLALVLLVLEWWIRDREEQALRSVNEELNAMRKVA
ncbi:MAG: hypothetical protein H7Z40_04305 [Phycisphaerae bacterium]|nr:hypothetical protein [Gemmatimonadaceae bacterium]